MRHLVPAGVWFVDVDVGEQATTPLSCTFHRTDTDRWKERELDALVG